MPSSLGDVPTVPDNNAQPFTGQGGSDDARELTLEVLRTGVGQLVAGVRLNVLSAEQVDDALAGCVSRYADPVTAGADVATVVDLAMADLQATGWDYDEPARTPQESWQDAADDLLLEAAVADPSGAICVELLARWCTMAAVLLVENHLTSEGETSRAADALADLVSREADRVVPLLAPLRKAVVDGLAALLEEVPSPDDFAAVALQDLYDRATDISDAWAAAAVAERANVGHARAAALAITVRLLVALLTRWPMPQGQLGAQVTAQSLLADRR